MSLDIKTSNMVEKKTPSLIIISRDVSIYVHVNRSDKKIFQGQLIL